MLGNRSTIEWAVTSIQKEERERHVFAIKISAKASQKENIFDKN